MDNKKTCQRSNLNENFPQNLKFNNDRLDKSRALILKNKKKRLQHKGQNDWLKFLEQLKKLDSAKICQTEAQLKRTYNKHL